jgi:hypothetical protein
MDIQTITESFRKEVLEDKIFDHKCLNCHLRNFYTKHDNKCSFCNHKFNMNKCIECNVEIINCTLCPLHNKDFYFNVTDIYKYFVNVFSHYQSSNGDTDETETIVTHSTITQKQNGGGETICIAKKANGDSCTKIAKTGSLYCGYHRNYNKQ